MSIRGSSHVVRTSRGADRASEKNRREKLVLLSLYWLSVERLMRLISRLYIVGLIQTILFFDNQVKGISIIEGKIIFNIVGG